MTSQLAAFDISTGHLAALRRASPLLCYAGLACLLIFLVLLGLMAIDYRQFNGINLWIKPAKFHLSLGVLLLTQCFALMMLPEPLRRGRTARTMTLSMVLASAFELGYITFRAARGEASHFNETSLLTGLLYSAMGLAAAWMMLVTIWIGIQVLRKAPGHGLALAIGSSFILSGLLTLAVGFTLGGMGSHWIGGDQTDATGLPVMGWSTTGGDLRVAHFFALHLMQVLPFAAWIGGGRAAIAAAAAGLAVVALTYVQALNGLPFIPL